MKFVMKVGAVRPAGLPYVADDFALDDAAARSQPQREIPQVRVVRAVSPVVPEHDEVSVPVPTSRERHDTVTGRLHPRSDRSSIVNPLVRAPLVKNRMPAQAEPGGDTREFERLAQESLAQFFAFRFVIPAPSPGSLIPYVPVLFQDPWGRGGYYPPDGENLRKVFLRSPLEFSRITSGFGLRRHPIFHQWRAHQGVDYGAPVGTRVKSTGDGIVSFAGRRNGYGNLIVLRHHGGYSTYYAHLRNFALGLRAGSRVVQGEIIGYVGQTGWADGPHLHYEFHLHNQNRNPLTMVFPAAQPIPAIELAAFRRTADSVIARLDLLKNGDLALLE